MVRRASPSDRRARIPEATAAGANVLEDVERRRDQMQAGLLADVSADDEAVLRKVLVQLVMASSRSDQADAAPRQ